MDQRATAGGAKKAERGADKGWRQQRECVKQRETGSTHRGAIDVKVLELRQFLCNKRRITQDRQSCSGECKNTQWERQASTEHAEAGVGELATTCNTSKSRADREQQTLSRNKTHQIERS